MEVLYNMLFKMFIGGTTIGVLSGMGLMCIITLIVLKIAERFGTDD